MTPVEDVIFPNRFVILNVDWQTYPFQPVLHFALFYLHAPFPRTAYGHDRQIFEPHREKAPAHPEMDGIFLSACHICLADGGMRSDSDQLGPDSIPLFS